MSHSLFKPALLLAAVAAAAGLGAAARPVTAAVVPVPGRAAEVARIRAHFDSVERELLARDVSALPAAARARRAEQIRVLAAYRERGVFPRNHDFPDLLVPYFVDQHGVLCAVAHLLATSGRRDVVDRVAAADNNVWVPLLAGDTAFTAWLDAQGLTLAEAARIQMPYDFEPIDESGAARRAPANGVNTAASVATAALGVTSMLLDAPAGNRRATWRTALGVVAGGAGLALAASRRDARGGPLAVGIATGVVSAASVGVAGWRLAHRSGGSTPLRSAHATSERPTGIAVAPAVGAGSLGVALTF